MTRKTVVQSASLAFVAAVTASLGMTSFVTADTITHTGPHSQNKAKPIIKNKCEIDTENNVDIQNENKQKAESGDVSIKNDEHKDGDHDKWESETPKNDAQPSSVESTDQPEEQPATASQAAATISEADQTEGQQESIKSEGADENWKPDHEDHNQSKVGDVSTGDAINSNESKFKVNIETDNECPVIKKVPKVHKPEHKMQPSMKPKAQAPAPKPSVAPTSGGGGGQGMGAGVAAAPRVSQPAPQPVARPIQAVQPPAPKPAAPCPPEQAERVSNSFKATTTNNVSISNTNYQSAKSGDVKISNNGHVGDVSTGDAVNENSTYASVNIETSNTSN